MKLLSLLRLNRRPHLASLKYSCLTLPACFWTIEPSLLVIGAPLSLTMMSSSQLAALFCITVTVLDLAPLAWQFHKRNIAVIALSIWLAQGSLWTGLNLLIWEDNIVHRAAVYCDISRCRKLSHQINPTDMS